MTPKNPYVLAPMTTYSSQLDGVISPDELPYLERRAKGGFGIVMTAACCVHPTGWAFKGQWQCSDDRFIPSLKSVSDVIRSAGANSVLQIHHGGRQCPPELCGGTPLSASAIPLNKPGAVTPRAMTEGEIVEVIEAFGAAAHRAVVAGFDGIEIHGANTYLLQQFVSPHSNRRTDIWGQDRLKFSREVVESVLKSVPDGFSVGYRFSPEEPDTPGLRMADTLALIDTLVQYQLDFLHVSLRDYKQTSFFQPEDGPTLNRIADHINGRIKLIGVGSVKTLEDAQAVQAAGADWVAIGRCGISEPEWPDVALNGGTPRTKVHRSNFAQELTLPKGLADRIDAVEGWFDRD